MPEWVICDCDNTMGLPGKPVDDGQTLLYLLGRPDIELMGVTTTFGNGSIDEVYQATQTLLHDLGRDDIPLLKGAGRRGQPPTEAARFLAESAASHSGQITVLAIGPLGNLRAAAELDPDFFGHLKGIAIMGGYLHPLPLPGWEDVPELNLASDPEAAWTVLNAPRQAAEVACPITLMNAHICLQAPFGLAELAPIEAFDPRAYGILRDYLLTCQSRHITARDYLWDLLPAVYLSYPDLFDDNPVWIGSTVADLERGTIVTGAEGEGALINMPTRILDIDQFYAILYEAWAQASLSAA
ncbi:MAG: nucleoside hydrolase [Anaerolineae bacterium]